MNQEWKLIQVKQMKPSLQAIQLELDNDYFIMEKTEAQKRV